MDKNPYRPKHLERWFERVNYEGASFDGYYVASWRLMRASPTERSNHAYIEAHVEDSVPADQRHLIQTVTFTDEIYSYRYYVLIHESCEKALKMADMLVERVRRKGSLDPEGEALEDLRSVKAAWKSSGMRAKIRMCAEAEISIFVARRKNFPDGVTGLRLYGSLNETDQEAAELNDDDQ